MKKEGEENRKELRNMERGRKRKKENARIREGTKEGHNGDKKERREEKRKKKMQ